MEWLRRQSFLKSQDQPPYLIPGFLNKGWYIEETYIFMEHKKMLLAFLIDWYKVKKKIVWVLWNSDF